MRIANGNQPRIPQRFSVAASFSRVLGRKFAERQAVLLRHEPGHRHRGLDRNRIGFDELVAEERIIFAVIRISLGEITLERRPDHRAHLARDQVRRDADDPLCADRHHRQRQRIVAGEHGDIAQV